MNDDRLATGSKGLYSGHETPLYTILRASPGPIAIPDTAGRLRKLTMAQAMAFLGVLAATVLMISAPDLPRPGPMEAAALLVLFLGLWITKTVPDHLAAIIFFIAAVSVIGVPPGPRPFSTPWPSVPRRFAPRGVCDGAAARGTATR